MNDILCTTESAGGMFKIPMIEIESENFTYSNTGIGMHGMQNELCLSDKADEIKNICADISDKLLELFKLIND